jgi:hypothetical protein
MTPEQEQRAKAIIDSGWYRYRPAEAARMAMEKRAHPDFEGTDAELQALLLEGLGSSELSENKFWRDVNRETDRMLADRTGARQ